MKKEHFVGAAVAEELLLACVLVDKQSLDLICLEVHTEMFLVPKHQIIFQHLYQLYKKGMTVDVTNLFISLTQTNEFELAGGQATLKQLAAAKIDPKEVNNYIEWVKNAYLRRNMQELALRFLGASLDMKQTIEQVLTKTESSLIALLSQKAPAMTPIGEIIDSIEHELKNPNQIKKGYLTKYVELDKLTQGLQKQDMIVVAARPSVGKTAFALNLVNRIDAEDKGIIVFSLEMNKTQISNRLLSLETRLSQYEIQNNYKKYEERIQPAMDKLRNARIFIQDDPNMTVEFIRAQAKRKYYEYGGLALIVIDYLQLIREETLNNEKPTASNRVQALANMTRSLKALARELDVPVVVLSQLSRNVEYRTAKVPVLSDLRESGSIEQDADLVIFLHKDAFNKESNYIEVILAKHRNGPCGQFYLLFHPPTNTFSNSLVNPNVNSK
jgi:replicative DNA helicase|uniref:Replicative DNA helicase n=2 Tax=Cyanidioschyzon merolae TaxID=45157 RepID=Q85G14_CYAM1|nr:replication helicase subunit [Cyanidioschyzon merolae strain 10D]QFV16974.1 DNA replication helicase [Cyanidioschyzon merolae]QFV17152.1 DNA replication helicase [Cyanidioschyzon merolae]BAC76177.1 DNA replication helicase [Cyanidioschyzon merolae strain 10D]